MKTLQINSHHRCELIDITRLLQDYVKESGITSGILYMHVPHTTAGITINENSDPDVKRDLLYALQNIVPQEGYMHYEGNSDAHTKALITGFTLNLIIEEGKLVLGTWQAVYFCEFDGPRNRKVNLKIMEN